MQSQLSDLLAPYKGQKGVTIRVLQAVQEELGYLPREAIQEISKTLHLSTSMRNSAQPPGADTSFGCAGEQPATLEVPAQCSIR